MAQPEQYEPSYVFTDFQTSNPATPLPADKLDIELNNIADTTDQIRTNIALLQADDGTMRGGVVTPTTLSTATLALISTIGGTIRGAWTTGVAYAIKDVVSQAQGTYVCAVAHTAGTFATDLTAVKWVLIAGSGGTQAYSALSDVTITSVATNQLVHWNGTKWVNALLVDANITAGTISFASLATAVTITSTSLAGASNTNIPTSTAVKTYIDQSISRGTGTPVASASTVNLSSTSYDFVHITGVTTINAVTLATNEEVWVIFDGILTFTHSSGLILPSAANITTAVGDRCKLRGIDGTNVECLVYERTSGQPLVATTDPLTKVAVVKQQFFSSSGTYTPSTGMAYCIVESVDGGAGGGGVKCASASNVAVGTGGGGGAYGRTRLTAAQIGASQTVTIGAGGTAGSNAGGNGGAGGATSLGSLHVGAAANLGSGSTNATTTMALGPSAGGGGSAYATADFSITGSAAGTGFAIAGSTLGMGSQGGDSAWGSGALCGCGVATGTFPGNNAASTSYGGGGAGGMSITSSTGAAGGTGTKGAMLITEFCTQ